ncbi:MAG TPA: pitrilysin family protein [Longimicrobiales bacterium]|nr:pitrilysin family protein [Longimicrobiales bacterium]
MPDPRLIAPTLEHRLENGLSVLIREDRSAPVVAVLTHVKAGYFDEPDHLVGVSHVLEHMYFKGTERRGEGDMARETKALGGYLNAGTIYDYTAYYTVLPSSALALALDIQADALRHSAVAPDELARELGVIVEEAKRKLDTPRAVAMESLYAAMFDRHRMRRWRIGTEEGLRRLTHDDVMGFYRARYRPENIVLVVAGDVDAGGALELVRRFYGDMEPGGAPRDRGPAEPEHQGLRFRAIAGDIVHSHLEWGWRTEGPLHPDAAALQLLGGILGQGRASRLYREVREAGHASAIGAYHYTPTELGIFTITTELQPADTGAALRATWAAVERLAREGPTAVELERARTILDARFLSRLETMEGQARLLAEWQALGEWRAFAEHLRRLDEVDAPAVREAARRHLALEAATVLLYHPRDAAPPVEDAAAARALLRSAEGSSAAAPPEPSLPMAPPPPPAGPMPGRSRDGVLLYRTPEGLDIALKPRPGAPLVSMALCCRGGKRHEDPDHAGITGLTLRGSLKGTTSRSAARLAEDTEALGGSLSFGASADMCYWSLGVPARHFGAGLELLADAAVHATFPEPELERERQVALNDLARVRDDMSRYPARLFLEAAFGLHPYGFPLEVTEAGIAAALPAEVRAWHAGILGGSRPLAVVVGDIDPEAAAALLADRLAGVSDGEPPPEDGPPWGAGGQVRARGRPKAQTALALGFPGPRRDHPDVYPLQLLAGVLSGLGGRLFEELRSRRSLAYTVSAQPVPRWRAGAFMAYIATSPEREDEARAALLEELARVAEERVSEEELRRAQAYTIGAWQIRSQTASAQLAELTDALLLGGGLEEIRTFEERIRAVTPEDVRTAFGRVFDPERMVQGIVRGRGAA